MRRRPRRTPAATVVAVATLALSVAVIVSLIQRLTGTHEFVSYDTVAAWLHGTTWRSSWVLATGVTALVIGVLLLGSALVPGRAVVLPLTAEEDLSAGITRRGLRTTMREAAYTVEGVSTARIRLRRNRVGVVARTERAVAQELTEPVRAAVEQRLAELGPAAPPQVVARLRRTKNRGTR
ncbi:DUF6286 domain-containing protein [Nocardia sp. NPDC051570]|uniref:DUF6286 domain-containing protein n=1 Tax=Nocardia sp. NPDC051570 TaxID=3364324 RepID=UPI0037BBB7D6